MFGMSLVPRVLEFAASLVVFVLFVLVWRQTRIGGFGALAALRGVSMMQWLGLQALSGSGGGMGAMSFYLWFSVLLAAAQAFAVWNIYTHVKRIWAPAEAPPATVT